MQNIKLGFILWGLALVSKKKVGHTAVWKQDITANVHELTL
jgi:hypothetical protein